NSKAGYEKYSMNFVGPDSESDVSTQVQEFTSALNTKPDALGLAALD
ncbi:MAG TPA: LacI family transcriptional regulator, partial [Ruminococcaceae bacterium]|nr:LacI family transcriptional regulator [Oscillospiraceae bacterium]